jgi:shikimate dehydrogenase
VPAPAAYGLFGFPVHHSWSPFIHGLFARQTRQDMTYRLFESPPESFRHDVLQFFAGDGQGCNITVPHKRTAAELVNELTARAERADAVNTIVRRDGRLFGDNTDGAGLITDLVQNLKLELAGRRILLLGAGGAARGALAPLLAEHPAALVIANRTEERAIELAAEFAQLGPVTGAAFNALDARRSFDLIINATSASLKGDVPAISSATVGSGTACYDMAYGIGETPFTQWARDRAAAVIAQGWGMLIEQAAEAFYLWRGVRPETQPVFDALRNRAVAMASRNPA